MTPPQWPTRPARAALPIVAAAALLAAPTAAQAETLTATYAISLAGLPIGTANLRAEIGSGAYKLDIRAGMTGLAGAMMKSSGVGVASGSLTGAGRLTSSGYAINSTSSDGARRVQVAMNAGNVQFATLDPPLEDRPDRVPVTDAHRRGVVDPVSALLMPLPTKSTDPLDPSGCDRTIPIFDGATRFDVILSHKGRSEVRGQGYSGPALVCAARFVPHAGHRPDRRATQFMVANRDMEVWLVPVGSTRLLAPHRISVRTMVGMTLLEASAFQVAGATAEAAAPGTAGRARN